MTEVMDSGEHKPRIVWGATRIGAVIGRSRYTVAGLARKGLLPVRRVGGQWVAEEGQLLRFVGSGDGGTAGSAAQHEDKLAVAL